MNTSKHGSTWDLVVVWGISARSISYEYSIFDRSAPYKLHDPWVQMNEFKVLTGYDEQVLRCWSRNHNQIVVIIIITINIIFKLKKRIFNKGKRASMGPGPEKLGGPVVTYCGPSTDIYSLFFYFEFCFVDIGLNSNRTNSLSERLS